MNGSILLFVMTLIFLTACSGAAEPEIKPVHIKVTANVLNPIDKRVFGQFLERASFGEPGPEGVCNDKGELPVEVLTLLKKMQIPIVRFPGGTDMDYIDWTDMISNSPTRKNPARPITTGHTGKPITNRFGFDEYFRLRDQMGWETILVVNLLDGLAKRKSVEEAAMHAAGLVAYSNAPQGAKLPEGMPDWPAVRKKNGHPEPYKVKYFQIGNEAFLKNFHNKVKETTGLEDPKALAAWYIKVYLAYIKVMKAVDPNIQIIIDCWMGDGEVSGAVLNDPEIQKQVSFVARHRYAPGPMDKLIRDGHRPTGLPDQQWWNAWVSMPGIYDEKGQAAGFNLLSAKDTHGFKVAATEWNWNGWGYNRIKPEPGIHCFPASAIGTAGFIHGMMRQGEQIKIANQSMLVGVGWGIAAIHCDRDGKTPPYMNPQRTVTTFYNLHHGDQRLAVETGEIPCFAQPYQVGWSPPVKKAATLDVLATRNAKSGEVFLHLINRKMKEPSAIKIDLSTLGNAKREFQIRQLKANINAKTQPDSLKESQTTFKPCASTLELTLPEASITTVIFRHP